MIRRIRERRAARRRVALMLAATRNKFRPEQFDRRVLPIGWRLDD